MTPSAALYRVLLFLGFPWIAVLGLVFRATALLGLALGGGLLVALAWRRAGGSLRGLDVRREVYPSAFEGDAVAVELTVDNRWRRAAHLVEIGDAFGPGMFERQRLLEAGPLPPGRRRRSRYHSFCSRHWGVYTVGPLTLRSSDALGLFACERVVGQMDPFAVFPRVYDVAGLERLGARPSLTPQEVTSARSGQSAAYMGVRDYRAGDELRRVHWPATARRGAPVVKEFEVDLTPYFTLFLDLDRRNRAGMGRKSTLEYVVRTAASLLWTATCHGHVVQVHGEGAEPLLVPPGRGEMHLTNALYDLIRARQEGETTLVDLVERERAHLPGGSTAALLFATIDVDLARLEETLEAFRSRGVRPLLVFVNGESFMPIDRWALPPSKARDRCEALLGLLRSRGAPGAILDSSLDLRDELARADLFGEPV